MHAISLLKEKLQRVRGFSGDRERGQALIIVVMSVFGLLILVGLAVDLGLYYVERVRITRAVDAATLAAAYELPMEGAAQLQALDFLRQNGYDPTGPDTVVIVDDVTVGSSSGITKTTIWIDTAMFQDPPGSSDTAYQIQVQVRRAVPVIFLRFAGFDNIASYASAIAENINNLDVVLAFDKSGSMEFDTLCYGCWDQGGVYSDTLPCRNGTCYPLPWDGPANSDTPQHCDTIQRYQSGGYDYYFIEAEEYSYTNNTYSRDLYGTGYSYWALQRQPSTTSARWRSIDGLGAHIMHMPYPDMETYGVGVTCRLEEIDGNGDGYVTSDEGKCWSGAPGGPYDAPRVDYSFSPVVDGDYYIWVRGQAYGAYGRRSDGLDRRLFWGIDQIIPDDGLPVQLGWGQSGNCGRGCEGSFSQGGGSYSNGATSSPWQWRRLNDTAYYMEWSKQYDLSFWAGGSHFSMDRIVITTDYNGSGGNPPSGPITENNGRGRAVWADGRSGYACNPCDDRFAGYPADDPDRPVGFDPSGWVDKFPVCESGPNPDRRYSYLYDDEQPIRGSKEAVKYFVNEILDPAHDQIGYVPYSGSSSIASHLQCLRRYENKSDCTVAVIEAEVIDPVDATVAGGGTNIAGAIEDGLAVLRTGPLSACRDGTGPCGRPGATHVIILMTDGRPTARPNSFCDDEDLWENDGAYDSYEDCVMYYAREARDRNVIIFTITVGESADFDLMGAVADLTGGVFRPAQRPEQLPEIFAELYELMYLRLVE